MPCELTSDAASTMLVELHEEVKRLREEKAMERGTVSTATALAQVRNLAAKSGTFEASGSVLISAMEGLADAAVIEQHPEAEFYRTSLKECKPLRGRRASTSLSHVWWERRLPRGWRLVWTPGRRLVGGWT